MDKYTRKQTAGRLDNRRRKKLIPVPEFIDPVIAKTSPKRSFSLIKNERFGLFPRKLGL